MQITFKSPKNELWQSCFCKALGKTDTSSTCPMSEFYRCEWQIPNLPVKHPIFVESSAVFVAFQFPKSALESKNPRQPPMTIPPVLQRIRSKGMRPHRLFIVGQFGMLWIYSWTNIWWLGKCSPLHFRKITSATHTNITSMSHAKNDMHVSGQIIIFHQPRFSWNKGISLTKPPFGVRSCEVAIIWPDVNTHCAYIRMCLSINTHVSIYNLMFFDFYAHVCIDTWYIYDHMICI